MKFSGKHLMLDLEKCNLLSNHEIKHGLIAAIEKTGAHIVEIIEHEFDPVGYTCVVLIAESHASIHTFPECDSCFVDYFTCGEISIEMFELGMLNLLQPKKIRRLCINRGSYL